MQQESRVMEAAGTTSEEKWAYLDVGGLVRRRKGRIALGVFVGVALAVAACAVIGPWYESSARLLVSRKQLVTTPLSGTSPGQAPEDYLSTHILIITSPEIVGQAIEEGRLANLPCLRGKREPVREILDSLQVTRDPPKPGVVPSNEILNLSFRGRNRDDCAPVLKSIIDSYLEFLKETYRSQSAETLKLIDKAKDVVERDLKAKQDAYREFLQKSRFFAKGRDGKLVQEDHLMGIDARLAALRVRRAEIESALAAVDGVRQAGGRDGAVLKILAAVRSDRDTPAPDFLQRPGGRGAGGNQPGTPEEELLKLRLEEGKLRADG
jgi:polysaccharide biosynthesis transport protein